MQLGNIFKALGKGEAGEAAPAPGDGAAICALWQRLEDLLARPDHDGGGLGPALDEVREACGLSMAFLTLLFPDDKRNCHIVAASGAVPRDLPAKAPLASGLAGWVHSNVKPLAIEKLKDEGRGSYVFTKDEPLRGVRSFFGWPLLYGDKVKGALILAGREGETLAPGAEAIAQCAAKRLAAQAHLDRLIVTIADLGGVDSQTNLPHRGYFIEDLARMMAAADLKGEEMNLFVLVASGLGAFSCEHGQKAASELLRAIARELKAGMLETWALGHVSYGLFTLAIPSSDAAEARALIKKFQAHLRDWPLPDRGGRAKLGLMLSMASYPRDATGPEALLEAALTALTDGETVAAHGDDRQ